MTPTPINCYLLRDDGEWYELGDIYDWSAAFATFSGPSDGSVTLLPEDIPLLSLRLQGHGPSEEECNSLAADIVRWCQRVPQPRHWATSPAHSMRFRTDLDPEVDPDVAPTPITGSRFRLSPR